MISSFSFSFIYQVNNYVINGIIDISSVYYIHCTSVIYIKYDDCSYQEMVLEYICWDRT